MANGTLSQAVRTTLDHDNAKSREIRFRQQGDVTTLEALATIETLTGSADAEPVIAVLDKAAMDTVITTTALVTPSDFWVTLKAIYNACKDSVSV